MLNIRAVSRRSKVPDTDDGGHRGFVSRPRFRSHDYTASEIEAAYPSTSYSCNYSYDEDFTFQKLLETDGESDDESASGSGGGADAPLIFNGNEEDGGFPKARHIFGLMGFLGFAVVYAMRVNLSVAIVAMVNQTAIPKENSTFVDNTTCPIAEQRNNTKPLPDGEFVWDEATQGLVLGSFFYGYVLTQVPGGRLAETVGGKRIYGYGVLMTAIFTLLTPLAAHSNLTLFVLVRILEGMGEGVTYPAMHAMLAHWIPPLERNKFAAIVYAGSNIGTVISMPLTGWLCSLDFLGGWPSAFYIFGLMGLLWFLMWQCLVYDKPSVHPRISIKEKDYIEKCLREAHKRNTMRETEAVDDSDLDLTSVENNDGTSIPWKGILKSLPVWAILITQCGQSWAFYTQLTELPTYMSNILHYDIQSNAVLNAVPYFTSWIVGIACSSVADWMLKKRYISQLNSYKLWNSVATIIPALGLLGVGYVGCDWRWVTFMLAGVGSFNGAVYAGNQMNHIDLSPQYAGTMYGLTNSAANMCGFMAPYVIGTIINHHENLTRWRKVFWLAAGVSIFGNLIYLIFASTDEQQWSSKKTNRQSRSRSVDAAEPSSSAVDRTSSIET